VHAEYIQISGGMHNKYPSQLLTIWLIHRQLKDNTVDIKMTLNVAVLFRVLETRGTANLLDHASTSKYAEWSALQA
jgi:hypothetical protein